MSSTQLTQVYTSRLPGFVLMACYEGRIVLSAWLPFVMNLCVDVRCGHLASTHPIHKCRGWTGHPVPAYLCGVCEGTNTLDTPHKF